MPLAKALTDFNAAVAQCGGLIASAHRLDAAGAPLFQVTEQQQITVAAFLNMFIAWETFLEETLLPLMIGHPTIGGALPVRRVIPLTIDDARDIVRGVNQFFDYTNHMNMRLIAQRYFDQGYPYEPHLSSIYQDLSDLKTLRNSCAHTSKTTQTSLEALAQRIAGLPMPGASVYKVLTMSDPRPGSAGTALETYKRTLLTAADLIAKG